MNDEIDMEQYDRVGQAEVHLEIGGNACEGCAFDMGAVDGYCDGTGVSPRCREKGEEYVFVLKKEQP